MHRSKLSRQGGCAELVRATLQEDAARAARLRRAQEDYQAQDEHAGGQQGNEMLALQRGRAGGAGTAAAAAREKEKQERREDADTETGVRGRALLGSTPVVSFTVEVSVTKRRCVPRVVLTLAIDSVLQPRWLPRCPMGTHGSTAAIHAHVLVL